MQAVKGAGCAVCFCVGLQRSCVAVSARRKALRLWSHISDTRLDAVQEPVQLYPALCALTEPHPSSIPHRGLDRGTEKVRTRHSVRGLDLWTTPPSALSFALESPFCTLRFSSEVQDFYSLNFHHLRLGEMRDANGRNYFKGITLHLALICNVSKVSWWAQQNLLCLFVIIRGFKLNLRKTNMQISLNLVFPFDSFQKQRAQTHLGQAFAAQCLKADYKIEGELIH